jgi:hypothetical protein
MELQNRIIAVKKLYEKRNMFIKGCCHLITYIAGPKFITHGYSMFGDVLFTSALNTEAFVIFSTDNTMEIW